MHKPDLLRVANHTGFFRDSFVWDTLKKKIIPGLNKPIDVLIVGCSSGCEAYSIGIILSEMKVPYTIDAIDVDPKRIEEAKKGIFDSTQMMGVSPKRRKEFFVKKGTQYQIKKDLFKINFVAINAFDFLAETKIDGLLKEKSFKHNYDLVFCRNVLHYFDTKKTYELVNSMVNCLGVRGYLVFGTDDPIPKHPDIKLEYISERIFQVFSEPIKNYLELPYKTASNNWYATRVYNGHPNKLLFENKIIGIGGTGVNILRILQTDPPKNHSLIGADTCICPLLIAGKHIWICFGRKVTHGLGCGGSVKVAQEMLKEGLGEITEFIELNSTKKLFIIVGGGGATGTPTTLALIKQAKKRGIPVCVVITKPLELEKKRLLIYAEFISQIEKIANQTIIIDLQELQNKNPNISTGDIFPLANQKVIETINKITSN